MTEYDLRRKVAEMARSYRGVNERDGSHRAIIDLYNDITPLPRGYKLRYDDPWCAAFVSVVFSNCGLLAIAPAECGCGPMIELYRQLGRWQEADDHDAQIGDVVFYDWEDDGRGDDTGASDHVGVITDKRSGQFTVTEGNKNDAVGDRTLAVNGRYIRGFGLPDYAAFADGTPEPEPIPAPDAPSYTLELPLIVYGDTGRSVHAMQSLLIGDGYGCGRWGADGEFGDGTLRALRQFQSDCGLLVDGECGGQTWGALLGVS